MRQVAEYSIGSWPIAMRGDITKQTVNLPRGFHPMALRDFGDQLIVIGEFDSYDNYRRNLDTEYVFWFIAPTGGLYAAEECAARCLGSLIAGQHWCLAYCDDGIPAQEEAYRKSLAAFGNIEVADVQ